MLAPCIGISVNFLKFLFQFIQKVEVMEAAAKYIETLQTNLVGQIRTHGYPDKLKSYSSSTNRADDFDSIRRAVDNYASSTMKWKKKHFWKCSLHQYMLIRNHANIINKV